METSFNSEHKKYIRSNWSKPLLRFLTKQIKDKLIYLGLPSSRATDVLEWLEFIKIVIAFQCRDYPNASNKEQKRDAVEELDKLLNKLEREKSIENYILFDGYLEEVILRGYDNSPKQIYLNLNNFITLYNLDFCNKITSPLEFINQKGDIETAYKFNAINKLLHIQNSLKQISNRFIFFLTVHCSYEGKELQNFIDNPPSDEIKLYLKKCNKMKGYVKNARVIRIFVAHHIQKYFSVYGFTPKILPVLLYKGNKDTTLLHFTIFGFAANNTLAGAPSFQTLTEILNSKFVSIDSAKFVNKVDEFEGELDVELNPIKLFSDSKTFKKLWV